MRFEFPVYVHETEFGALVDPTVAVDVKTPGGYARLDFLIDSGADFTILPASLAKPLGVDIGSARKLRITGIACVPVDASVATLTLRIGDFEFDAPCLFSPIDDAPLVLGRLGFFSRFNITFDNRRKKIVLETI